MALALGLCLQPHKAWADRAEVSATGKAQATVVESLAVRLKRGLDFGLFTVDRDKPGTVVVASDGSNARFRGGVQHICDQDCIKPKAAQFEVMGEAGRRFTITTPQIVTAISNAQSVTANAEPKIEPIREKIAFRPRLSATQLSNNVARVAFNLGGILQVPAAAAAAQYHVNLPVIMTYN